MRASIGTTAPRSANKAGARQRAAQQQQAAVPVPAPDKVANLGAMDWLTAHHRASQLTLPTARSGETQYYFDHLWPFADPYVSPLNPIFLLDLPELASLEEREYWQVRDGLIPLLWFFKTHPNPRGLKSRLLVHRSFAPYVPPAWQDFVGLYELEGGPAAVRDAGGGKQLSLLLIGSVMPSYCSLKHLDAELERIGRTFGKARLKTATIQCFLPGRFEGFGLEHSQEFYAKFIVRLCREFGTAFTPISYADFVSADSYRGFHAFELNDRSLCADSYVLKLALTKGATVVGAPKASRRAGAVSEDGGHYVPIHPFAGYRIWKSVPAADRAQCDPLLLSGESDFPERSADVLRRYSSLVTADANYRYPWPQYFRTWAQLVREDVSRTSQN